MPFVWLGVCVCVLCVHSKWSCFWRRLASYIRDGVHDVYMEIGLYMYPKQLPTPCGITTADIITHTIIMLCHLFGNKRHHHDAGRCGRARVGELLLFRRCVRRDYDFRVRDFFNCVRTSRPFGLAQHSVRTLMRRIICDDDILSGKQVIYTMGA